MCVYMRYLFISIKSLYLVQVDRWRGKTGEEIKEREGEKSWESFWSVSLVNLFPKEMQMHRCAINLTGQLWQLKAGRCAKRQMTARTHSHRIGRLQCRDISIFYLRHFSPVHGEPNIVDRSRSRVNYPNDKICPRSIFLNDTMRTFSSMYCMEMRAFFQYKCSAAPAAPLERLDSIF